MSDRGSAWGPSARTQQPAGQWTLLHLSDTQFGQYHRFGEGIDSLASRLVDDIRTNLGLYAAGVDAVVISGDVTERALPSEFAQATNFIEQLTALLGLTTQDVLTVPGNHDVSWKACEAYVSYQESKGLLAQPPYEWKWANCIDFHRDLFGRTDLHRVIDLPRIGVAMALVNSTVSETHEDHWGYCGEDQLRELAAELRMRSSLFRIAVLHHNVRRKAEDDDENLRDEDDFTRILGPEVDLVLHGHTHDGKTDRLSDGTLVLATGSAAVNSSFRPGEVPNQYQLLTMSDGSLTRVGRRYEPDQKRFTRDNRIGPEDSPGIEVLSVAPATAARTASDAGIGCRVRRRLGIYG